MNKIAIKILAVLLTAASLLSMSLTVIADELSSSVVAGLPERLVVLDDKARSVSDNGEYCFEVENMVSGELYSKNIQIMNLREDAAYHVYFKAQPVSKYGEIDLENECEFRLFLGDSLIYSGKVTGEGTPDVREEPLDLGKYAPGDSRVLRAEIVWHDSAGAGDEIDNGYRIYDAGGVEIVRGKSGKTHISGEVIFKWIFTASVVPDDPDKPSKPDPFIHTGETIVFIAAGLFLISIPIMILLVIGKKKKKKDEQT